VIRTLFVTLLSLAYWAQTLSSEKKKFSISSPQKLNLFKSLAYSAQTPSSPSLPQYHQSVQTTDAEEDTARPPPPSDHLRRMRLRGGRRAGGFFWNFSLDFFGFVSCAFVYYTTIMIVC
jgi:hypothetical protein